MDTTPGSTDIAAAFRELHRRTGPAPRKRTRFAPAKAARQVTTGSSTPNSSPLRSRTAAPPPAQPVISTSPLTVPPAKPSANGRQTTPAANGRSSNGTQRVYPATLSPALTPKMTTAPAVSLSASYSGKNVVQRIADAQRAADALPRPDPRFVAGTPVLNSMVELASSIGVSLFSNGYARHDSVLAHSAGNSSPRVVDVLALPRLPYDYASGAFLRALELGVLPLEEDLPPEALRKYYDGCLVAEIFDYRGVNEAVFRQRGDAWRQYGSFTRVLLKRDACNHIADMDVLTDGMDDAAALNLESKVLLAEHPVLDLDPTPLRHNQRPLWRPLVRSKRRRGPRPRECAQRPPISQSALMLIAASQKAQLRSELRQRNAEASASTPGSTKVPGGRSPAPQTTAALSAMHQNARHLIFKTKPPRGPNVEPTKSHGRLRTVRLILPDKTTVARIRQANALAASGQGGGETKQQIIQNAFANLSRAGRQVCIIELVARLGKGCDVRLYRGVFGDRAKDVNKMSMGTVEYANQFMDHFKGIMENDGYICIHDGDPQQSSTLVQQQQLDARRRALQQQQSAAAAAAGNITPAGTNANAQAMHRVQAQKRQFQLLQQKQTPAQAAHRAASVNQQRQQLLQQQQQQQHLEQRQRQAGYPQNIAQLQQQAAQQRAVHKTPAQNMLNVQAALNAAAATKSAQRYSQQLSSLPRNRSPGGRPLAGLPMSIPPNQVPLPARTGRPGEANSGPETPIMSQMQQIQMRNELERRNALEEQRKRMAGQARPRYPPQMDPSIVLAQEQQVMAARAAANNAALAANNAALAANNAALAASNAIPVSALVPQVQAVPPGMQNAISPSLLQNLDTLSQSSLQHSFKQARDGSEAGSVDTPNSRSAKR